MPVDREQGERGRPLHRVSELKAALDLALMLLFANEPGDSRAVSDEFVSMADVLAGRPAPASLAIIDASRKRAALAIEAGKDKERT